MSAAWIVGSMGAGIFLGMALTVQTYEAGWFHRWRWRRRSKRYHREQLERGPVCRSLPPRPRHRRH